MKITHHNFEFEFRDEWWAEAEMAGFVPRSRAYHADSGTLGRICEVSIEDVGPVRREPIFRESPEGVSAHDRVISILRGFRAGTPMPPVEIVSGRPPHRYKLTHGAHRFYCALVAGFTHVPTVEGFDWDGLDR